MGKNELLYVIKPSQQTKETLLQLLADHKEVQFVSLMGVDLAGNDTDEKIPVNIFLHDIDKFLTGSAAQTDGSSVVLPGIATLNDARVDMEVDKDVNWYVDYNYEHFDEKGRMVGTLRMPCFLTHNGDYVDSRSLLKKSLQYVEDEILDLLKKYPHIPGLENIDVNEIAHLIFTTATELEFWVKSPRENSPIEALSSSQVMQEMYWQRTRGNVRTALEQTIEMLELYGLEPEMGHKECGGVKGQIDSSGHMTHINEQLEVDWKYNVGLQTADNEILARIIVKEVFRQNGLDISFQAKPIPGVAGSGEHTHVGIAAKLKNGKVVNLFAPADMHKDFLSPSGGAEYDAGSYADQLPGIVACIESGAVARPSWCYNELVKLLRESIAYLEDNGYEPSVRAFCWMQGENDACSEQFTETYIKTYGAMLRDLSAAFPGYFDECVYIDAGISAVWPFYERINADKRAFAEQAENRVYIDTIAAGLTTEHEPFGAPDTYHYDSDCVIKLGRLFARAMKL